MKRQDDKLHELELSGLVDFDDKQAKYAAHHACFTLSLQPLCKMYMPSALQRLGTASNAHASKNAESSNERLPLLSHTTALLHHHPSCALGLQPWHRRRAGCMASTA